LESLIRRTLYNITSMAFFFWKRCRSHWSPLKKGLFCLKSPFKYCTWKRQTFFYTVASLCNDFQISSFPWVDLISMETFLLKNILRLLTMLGSINRGVKLRLHCIWANKIWKWQQTTASAMKRRWSQQSNGRFHTWATAHDYREIRLSK